MKTDIFIEVTEVYDDGCTKFRKVMIPLSRVASVKEDIESDPSRCIIDYDIYSIRTLETYDEVKKIIIRTVEYYNK